MAIDLGEETLTVATTERTWRTEIESPLGAVPTVIGHRETVKMVDATVLARTSDVQVRRSLSEVANQAIDFTPSQPGKITGAEMAALVPAFIDKWREEDISQLEQNNPE